MKGNTFSQVQAFETFRKHLSLTALVRYTFLELKKILYLASYGIVSYILKMNVLFYEERYANSDFVQVQTKEG